MALNEAMAAVYTTDTRKSMLIHQRFSKEAEMLRGGVHLSVRFGQVGNCLPQSTVETFALMTICLSVASEEHISWILMLIQVVLHGIEVDSIAQTIELPQDKLLAPRAKLIALSQVSSLMFSSRVISPGMCFCHRLYR